jgi:glyoxylase-like metal-dependent hydrolase (beta-lactamase superfamily II)/rhodanese-related sulfurtransferase
VAFDPKGTLVIFRQVLYRDLGCTSYLLGDAGEAVVVDPRWDIDEYLEIAAAEHLRITHVVDTHEHADHVSGRSRLVVATGAQGHRPRLPGAEGEADTIAAGDTITVGQVCLTALGAAGHRPEHLALAVSDLSRGPEPWLVLTGDSLLIGDVARPDLAVEPAEGAEALHGTLASLLALGDGVEVWPAHVGGSLCGGAGLNDKRSSTIGYERRHNAALSLAAPAFVDAVTRNLPPRPPNITRIVAINRGGSVATPGRPARLDLDGLTSQLTDGLIVLDSRSPDAFDAGHLPGAVNLPVASAGFGTRAGWALDPSEPLVVVADDEAAVEHTAIALQAVGFWSIAGAVVADPDQWTAVGLSLVSTGSWDVSRLADGLRDGEVDLVDVREDGEWLEGHVAGSHHVPLHRIAELGALPPSAGRVTAVSCAGGVRAAFAASLLRRTGRDDVIRIAGGGIGDLAGLGVALTVGPELVAVAGG